MAPARTCLASAVPADMMILDVGKVALLDISARFETAKTVVWNGPLGAFEVPPFDNGTNIAARQVAMLTKIGMLVSVAGGGDTVAALNNAGAADDFTYVSTAGGAFPRMARGQGASRRRGSQTLREEIMTSDLERIANAMVTKGKGILAADESSGTIKKRFDSIKVESTEPSRRDYREMLFRTPAMKDHISGVILYDETIRQKAKDGTPLPKIIEAMGTIPGIKVDKGTKPLPFCPNETITEGLDGLRERCVEYFSLGARFTKWRAVIDIGERIPSYAALITNAHALGRYAAISQDASLVPIVEPEVLMDGGHDIDMCAAVTQWVLKTVFEQLYYQKVQLEGMVLKPNMVLPGKKSPKQASVEEVAEKTIRVMKECVPAAVPGSPSSRAVRATRTRPPISTP